MVHVLLRRDVQARLAVVLVAFCFIGLLAWLFWPAPSAGTGLQGRWRLEPVVLLGGMTSVDPKTFGFSGEMTITENAVVMGAVAVRASFEREGDAVRVRLADDLLSFTARLNDKGELSVAVPGATLVYRRI